MEGRFWYEGFLLFWALSVNEWIERLRDICRTCWPATTLRASRAAGAGAFPSPAGSSCCFSCTVASEVLWRMWVSSGKHCDSRCSDGDDNIQEYEEQAEGDEIQGLDEAIYNELNTKAGQSVWANTWLVVTSVLNKIETMV